MCKYGSHLSGPIPPALCNPLSRTQHRQNNVWNDLAGIFSIWTPWKIDSGVVPSRLMVRLFIYSAAALNAKGQSIESIICGKILIPWSKSVCAIWVSCLFLFSMMPLWWWVPTPQCVWFDCCIACINKCFICKVPIICMVVNCSTCLWINLFKFSFGLQRFR